MDDEPLLAVRGEAILEVDPEIAIVSVTVAARDADRAKTLRLLNERAGIVDALLARFVDAIEKVETASVRVSPQLKSPKPRERVTGYVGVVQHTITVTDFERLGELVAQLADLELTEVSGPWWALRPNSPVHRRARTEAVEDALGRARDYAEALGSRVSALVELADTGLLAQGEPVLRAAAASAYGVRAAAGPEEFTFDIAPAKQTVRSTVEARFRMTQPDLSASKP